MNNLLEVKGLKKIYGKFSLDGIDISVPRGEIVGLIGPNGSGKTTTMRLLMNMIRRDSGRVEIFGMDPVRFEKKIKNRIGFVGEEQHFYENKKVSWTGRFVSHFFEDWDQTLFENLVSEFDIDPGKKIRSLSKGMKVKLSIAIALSHDPELLVLDEPTAGLDPVIRREILDRLMRFRGDEEKSIFISSHITDDIMRIADRVMFIVDGRVVINSQKDDIMANWKRIHFKDGAIDISIESSLKGTKDHMFGRTGVTSEYSAIKDRLEAGVDAGDVKVENVSLDDVLISFVKGE